MSEYNLDINGVINLSDYSSINDYIDVVGESDKLIININYNDKDNFKIICSMLKDKGFDIIRSEELKDCKYYIVASRKNKMY
ncbi:hypothetical protein BD780_003608 [Clostridium tetanomorphum]|uniref:Uncharacterized protein n=1 Tax=Clostridium tetanomorphum TaxID=1553 RepID=A0A923EDC6_CLOTT|nr:hypothetical protein [Clostridium tetanomorphum]KAJ52202.1 hypothetical protein CTM_08526 [Clostridium tetanomorphum DSM 665]MBC2399981.1 hypothetical protein [Clostridium tetanomorphum]MBP1863807.1 hypothetical protein [Clostridium tetanomorphum]NRS86383.1 hypothetical protein [Clostridium tetanomorphum]NRZ95587.1 hypothetical protein [Clostridium tetanomorphum]